MVCGYKGLGFFEHLVENIPIQEVISYQDHNVTDTAFEKIQEICNVKNIRHKDLKRLSAEDISFFDLVFVVGWQYMLPVLDNIIVFHDSLLPKYRGFAPTVNALINGEKQIGVTAFSPREGVDTGPILGQAATPITYPIKIRDAFDMQITLAGNLAIELFKQKQAEALRCIEQDEDEATYSIWRDQEDFFIDWTLPSETIVRTIDALGWPYNGARSYCGDSEVVLLGAESVYPKKKFENPNPGKIWNISPSGIEVLTGTGTICLNHVLDCNGERFQPEKLRQRFTSKRGS